MSAAELNIQTPHPYPDSYYAGSANLRPNRPSLTESIEADICVIGAGFTGLSTALFAAESGLNVVILEASHVGWGGAGRNGGHLINGAVGGMDFLAKAFGQDAKDTFQRFYSEGADIIKGFVDRYDIQCDLKAGQVLTAYTKKHMNDLEKECRTLEGYGIKTLSMIDHEESKRHASTDVYLGGLVDSAGGHLHPLNLALGEAAAFESLGGTIYERSPMISMESQGSGAHGGKTIIKTSEGQVIAKKVVVCGEAYLGKTNKQLSKRVLPASTQVIATRPLGDLADELMPSDSCVADCRYILDYFRLSADKRMVFGGGTVYGGTTPNDIETKLRKNMNKVFPQLKGIEIDYAWSGNIAITYNRFAQLGKLDPNIYYAHGFSGHGVNNTHIFGKIIAEALNENTARFDAIAKVPWSPFPGGQTFRVPYSVAGSWWYGLRDKFGI